MNKLLSRLFKWAQAFTQDYQLPDESLDETAIKTAFKEALAAMPSQYEHKMPSRIHADERVEQRYKGQFHGKHDIHKVLDFFNTVFDDLNTNRLEYWRYFPVPSKWAVRWPFEKNINGKEFLGIFEVSSKDNIRQPRFFWMTCLVDDYNNNGQGTAGVEGYLEPMLEKIKAGQVKMVTPDDFGRGRGKQIEKAKAEKSNPLQSAIEMAEQKLAEKIQKAELLKTKAQEAAEFAELSAQTLPSNPSEQELKELEAASKAMAHARMAYMEALKVVEQAQQNLKAAKLALKNRTVW